MDYIQIWLQSAATRILPVLILLAAGLLVIRIVMRLIKLALEKSRLEKAAHTLILSSARIVLYILLCLILASSLGIDVTSIVALASVLTLAISLSVQNALSNVIGGFTLLCTKPFVTGDFVEIAGQSGTVKQIGLTYTKLATPDNKLISIPNNAVTAAEIVNYTTTGKRRAEVQVCASYSTPVETVLEALIEAARLPMNLEDPAPSAVVVSYDESAIRYKLFVWCDAADYWTSTFATTRNVKAVFDANGVEMTYPHVNVHIEK